MLPAELGGVGAASSNGSLALHCRRAARSTQCQDQPTGPKEEYVVLLDLGKHFGLPIWRPGGEIAGVQGRQVTIVLLVAP